MDDTVTPAQARGPRSRLVWAAALLGAWLSLLVLHPGQYPFDSAFQLWQARSGDYWNVTPVNMPLLWSLLLHVFDDPSSLLWLNLAMYWTGIALCFDAVQGPRILRAVLALACGLFPLSLVQMGHLLSDAHLAALLVLIAGLVADGLTARRRAPLVAALLLLLIAGGIRHNALLATLPFAVLLARALVAGSSARRAWMFGSAGIVLATLVVSFALDRVFVVERKTTWPSIALWDLAAISLEVDRLLLPDFTHGPGLSLAELRETGAFDPATNTRLFERSRSGIGSGLGRGYAPQELAGLRASWWSAVTTHPLAWLRHRARTFALLAGPARSEPHGLVYFAGYTRFADNPDRPPAALAADWNAGFYALAERLRPGWLFSAWPPLAMLALAGLLAWSRRREPLGVFVLASVASALLYAAGFFFLAPGAELRYLTWPIVLAPVALAIALVERCWPFVPAPGRGPIPATAE